MRQNNVYKLMVVTNSDNLLEKNKTVDDLSVGQVGFFNSVDKKSFDSTSSAVPKEFYVLTKYGEDEYVKNSGIFIDKTSIKSLVKKEHVEGQNAIYRIKNYTAKAETEYHLSVEFLNPDFLSFFGKNKFSVTYHYKTSCCGQDCNCPDGNCNELTKGMVNAINADSYNLIKAYAIATSSIDSGTYGTSQNYAENDKISDDDMDILIAWNNNPDNSENLICTGIEIETQSLPLKNYCIFNIGYTKFKEVDIKVTPVDNFGCNADVTEVQSMIYEKGKGYDIKELEAFASGWEEPYRTSLEGITKELSSKVEEDTFYNLYIVNYTENTPGSDGDFVNDFILYIAIESTKDDDSVENMFSKLSEYANYFE